MEIYPNPISLFPDSSEEATLKFRGDKLGMFRQQIKMNIKG